MWLLFWLLVGVLLAALLVLGILVCVPWVVSITGTTAEARLRVVVSAFRAGSPVRVRLDETSFRRKKPKPPKPKPERRRRGSIDSKRLLAALPRLLTGLLRMFRIELLQLSGRLGLSDPSDTGQLFGVILPIRYALQDPRFVLDLEPEFSGFIVDAEVEARIRVHLVRGLPALARFLWDLFGRRT